MIMILSLCGDKIGYTDGSLIRHSWKDLALFKQFSLHTTVVMGRITLQSLPKKLPERKTWLLSNTLSFHPHADKIFSSLQEAIDAKEKNDVLCIAGGKRVYEEAFPYANILYVTQFKHYHIDNKPVAYAPENVLDYIYSHNGLTLYENEELKFNVYYK